MQALFQPKVRPMPFHLSEFLPYQLAVAAAHVSREFSTRYRKEFGLSIPEWRVLAHIAQEDRVSVREIQARVDMDKTKVSRAAAKLEASGLIEKRAHAEDRRLLDMRLTGKGVELFSRLAPIAEAYQAELVASLGADAESFRKALSAMQGKRNLSGWG